MKASNFSTGANVLFWLAEKVAKILDQGFDCEIVERHHRGKKDAPSGTAKTLAEAVADARGYSQEARKAFIRCGRSGKSTAYRSPMEIGVQAVRGGGVFGDHDVMFLGDDEEVTLTHKASNRDAFANGALRAAEWVVEKLPGLYDMQDVLGLPESTKPVFPSFGRTDSPSGEDGELKMPK